MKSHFDTEYNEVELGQVCRVGDGAHSKVERKESGIPYITSKNIEVGHLDTEDVDYISEEDYRRIFPDNGTVRRPKPGDVLIGIIGSFGNAYRYTESDHFGISSAVGVLRPDESKLDSDFLYYVVTSDTFRAVHESVKGGSVQGYTNTDTIQSLPLVLPPLPVQRRIADILGALDDKIELNRRMNETLEEMARALYRHWFVDFGPFQDQEFKDTEEMGPIPKGWEVGSLEDIVQNVRGTADPDDYPDSFPYIGLGEMPKGSIHLSEWQRAEEAGSKKRHFEAGQFLFGKLRPYFKKVGIAPVEGICSTDMLVLEPASENTRSMALGQLIQDDFIDFTDQASTGTSHPRISWKRMRGYDLALPPAEVAEEFGRIVDPWLDQVTANIRENKTLAETRDYLLPKLISGEIEVEATQEVVEAEM